MAQTDPNLVPVLEGEIVKKPLHFFWLVDCSGSMQGSKINSLNRAISEAIPEIQKALKTHPEVQVFMKAIKFSEQAEWHIGPGAVPIENFFWPELSAYGPTATASAIDMLSMELDIEKMSKRAYPPVCILLSDGYCTESDEAYEAAIAKLNKSPWGKKAVRLVIAIGNENEYDEAALLSFTNHDEVGLLKAKNPEQLVHFLKWVSVNASIASSLSRQEEIAESINDNKNVILPQPEAFDIDSAGEVF